MEVVLHFANDNYNLLRVQKKLCHIDHNIHPSIDGYTIIPLIIEKIELHILS